MPRLSTWLVRVSLVCLVAGALLGAALLSAPATPALRGLERLVPAHVELMLVGWLVQLAMGVAYWILPRAGGDRPASGLAGAGAAGVAVGLAAAVAGTAAAMPRLVTVGRALELAGAALFGLHVVIRLGRWRRLDLARRASLQVTRD